MNGILTVIIIIASSINSFLSFELFDQEAMWPLCGRIAESNPEFTDSCPAERIGPDYTDFPILSTFGPRLIASGNYRYIYNYDFNRGIDLECPVGTPVFAILDGQVTESTQIGSSSNDFSIRILHLRPINVYADIFSNYSSVYQNLSKALVSKGDTVTKGTLIGFSGESSNGIPHLHFEIRNSPGPEDKDTATVRDCIHPLQVLPYLDTGASNFIIDLKEPNLLGNSKASLEVLLEIENSELDLIRLEVEVFGISSSNEYTKIEQPGSKRIGRTPRDFYDSNTCPWNKDSGYFVNPPFYDMRIFNLLYTITDTKTYKYKQFQKGGEFQVPFFDELPETSDPEVFLARTDPDNKSIGEFNGIRISPEVFHPGGENYRISFTFSELYTGEQESVCFRVQATDARENKSDWKESKCIENKHNAN